jgi:hypothetical protein
MRQSEAQCNLLRTRHDYYHLADRQGVFQRIRILSDLLNGRRQRILPADVSAARCVLAKHIQKLVLTPEETPEGPVLAVSGDVDLFGGDERVMLVVARDGIRQDYTGPTVRFASHLRK